MKGMSVVMLKCFNLNTILFSFDLFYYYTIEIFILVHIISILVVVFLFLKVKPYLVYKKTIKNKKMKSKIFSFFFLEVQKLKQTF